MEQNPNRISLIVDEFDNFANEDIMGRQMGKTFLDRSPPHLELP